MSSQGSPRWRPPSFGPSSRSSPPPGFGPPPGDISTKKSNGDPMGGDKTHKGDGLVPFHTDIKNNRVYSYCSDQKPSSLLHLSHIDAFIVGTYELVDQDEAAKRLNHLNLNSEQLDDKLKAVNYRLGSLLLFVNTYSDYGYRNFDSHSCESGVFDMANCLNLKTECCKFFVAHANGTIRQYEVRIDKILPKSEPIQIVDDTSVLLTCIDSFMDFQYGTESHLVIGDSKGSLSYVMLSKNSDQLKTPYRTQICGDPVWQVKFLPSDNGHSLENHIILVGAENSCWYIYRLNYNTGDFVKLYKNDDFRAGVTSICFRSVGKGFKLSATYVCIGSYDETIRQYMLIEKQHDMDFDVIPDGSIRVPGAGIWRMDYLCHAERDLPPYFRTHNDGKFRFDQLCIASMYRAPCRILIPVDLKLSSAPVYEQKISLKSLDEGRLVEMTPDVFKAGASSGKPSLYYGFMHSKATDSYCIIDFNYAYIIFVEEESPYALIKGCPMKLKKKEGDRSKCSYALKHWLESVDKN